VGEFWEGVSLRIVHQSGIVAVADVFQAVIQLASILLNVQGKVVTTIIIIIIADRMRSFNHDLYMTNINTPIKLQNDTKNCTIILTKTSHSNNITYIRILSRFSHL